MSDAFSGLDGASNATQTIHPKQWMSPGWYWAFLPASQAGAAWTAFTGANPAVRTRKTVGTGTGVATEKGSWVLFQVTGTSPVIWTLAGFPSVAMKGEATEYSDVVDQSNIDPSAITTLDDFFKNLGSQFGTAGKVLLWGGVAILLWNAFQLTGGTTTIKRRAVTPSDDNDDRPPRRARTGTLTSYR